MVKGDENQLSLYDEKSGRKLTVSTTLPAVQIYTGNFLDEGCNGKQGKPYENRDGVAIEPQFLPDSIHIEKEPKVILRKGEIYKMCIRDRSSTDHFGKSILPKILSEFEDPENEEFHFLQDEPEFRQLISAWKEKI